MNAIYRLASVCLVLVFCASASIAQPPDTLWTQTYGGTNWDHGYCVEQTNDSGYVVAGFTQSFGNGSNDFWLIKMDSDGNEHWNQTYGGSENDICNYVTQTADGGYIITGYTYSSGPGAMDLWLIKTDSIGNEMWSQTFGGIGDDYGACVKQNSSGGYIVTGYTESFGNGSKDVWLIRTDSEGNWIWSYTYGGPDVDFARCLQITDDGGYIIAGNTRSFGAGDSDTFLIRTDSDGNELWSRVFGGYANEIGKYVQITADGGFITTGGTFTFGAGSNDIFLIKTDSDGNFLWSQTFGDTGSEEGRSVQQTSDGGYIICGFTTSFGNGDEDIWLIKTDLNGNETWNLTIGGQEYDSGFDVRQLTDGGYIVVGATNSYAVGLSDLWLIRIESDIPQVTVSIMPDNPPVQIPVSGGSFDFNATIVNLSNFVISFDAWTELDLLNGNTYSPILLRQGLSLPAGGQFDVMLSQAVPGFLLSGVYTFRGCVGIFPDIVLDSSEFEFEKLSPNGTHGVSFEGRQVRLK